MSNILHIMISKMILRYTDTVLGQRYTIGIQSFSAYGTRVHDASSYICVEIV